MKFTAFWGKAPGSIVYVNQLFRSTYWTIIMVEVVCTSETSVYFSETTRRYIPKLLIIHFPVGSQLGT
jgi:hypothetical protein